MVSMNRAFSKLACISGLAAILIFSVAICVPAAEKGQDFAIPADARGFAGTIQGRVVSSDDTGTTLVLKVEKADAIAKYAKWNKAKKPAALKDRQVMIYARWVQDQKSKAWAPDATHTKFVKGLASGAKTTVDVYSDAYSRLILVEVPQQK